MFKRVIFTAVVALACAGAATAAERPTSGEGTISLPPGPEVSDTYGTSTTAVWLPAAAFSTHDSATTYVRATGSGGAKARTGGTGQFWAELNLPNGAIVTRAEVHHFDNSTSNSGFFCMTRYNVDTTFGLQETCQVYPAGTPGNSSVALTPSATIATIDNRHPYVFHIFVDGNNPTYHFWGVRVVYRLQVSPAPAVATFPNDVPTTHPIFRFVEALASSGITGGCGAGSYCPDAPLTRGQMAVFLSTALGLNFPDAAIVP